MIDYNIFERVKAIVENNDKITGEDILFALTEELGEYSRACRVEDFMP